MYKPIARMQVMKIVQKVLGIEKQQYFKFKNQNSNALYYLTNTKIMKLYNGHKRESNVSLNYLLSGKCKIKVATLREIEIAKAGK